MDEGVSQNQMCQVPRTLFSAATPEKDSLFANFKRNQSCTQFTKIVFTQEKQQESKPQQVVSTPEKLRRLSL
jgi:hypothetical protein